MAFQAMDKNLLKFLLLFRLLPHKIKAYGHETTCLIHKFYETIAFTEVLRNSAEQIQQGLDM